MPRNEKNKKWFIVMAAVILCFAFVGTAWAGTGWGERQKVLASDGASNDNFGLSVSISGDYAIAGSMYNDDYGADSGSAYILHRDGETWLQQQKLLSSDGAVADRFGTSVAISGDYVIVGASEDDDAGGNSGSAYIFKRDGEIWIEQAKLLASDGGAGDCFGWSVSISGDYAIVGAPFDDNFGAASSGSAYIFHRSGETWPQQAKLLNINPEAGDEFGGSVSISGDYAIVGAKYDDDQASGAGAACVFRWTGASWAQLIKLYASDGTADDEFGISVHINGDLAIVGAYWDNSKGNASGSAYIYKRAGAIWSEQQKLIASEGAAGDLFGISVSISGDYAIVGAQYDDEKGSDCGSAYIFGWNGRSWIEQQELIASDGAASDYFGSVSISGDNAIVGAYMDDDRGSASGSGYVFVRCPIADLSNDCFVDFVDLSIMAAQWLQGL